MLAHLSYTHCHGPEALKSWSQNLGHEGVLTTLTSYGKVSLERQKELVRGARPKAEDDVVEKIRQILAQ